jgi:hypothetical protein
MADALTGEFLAARDGLILAVQEGSIIDRFKCTITFDENSYVFS